MKSVSISFFCPLLFVLAVLLSGCPATVVVPDLQGLTQSEAEGALSDADLVLGTVGEAHSTTTAQGLVLSQEPASGVMVDAGSAVSIVISLGPEMVQAPEVRGVTLEEAQSTLAALNLEPEIVEVCSDDIAPGVIISQSFEAGASIAVGTHVTITVSLGPAPVFVPDLTGSTQSAAESALAEAGLTAGEVTTLYSEAVPAGQVLGQDPAASSEVARGSTVSFQISLGPEPPERVLVPNVVGLPKADAESALAANRLALGNITNVYDSTVPAGVILTQDPASGTSVPVGSTISLTISRGPEPVVVPAIVGLSQGDAEAALSAAGLNPGTVGSIYSATVAAGIVLSQGPNAGALVAPGTSVSFTVSQGPEPVRVPDLRGLTQSAAESALAAVHLILGTVSEAYSSTVDAGRIVQQSPGAGTLRVPGSPVAITLSLGPEPVTVPDLAGLTRSAAREALTQAHLTLGTVAEAYSDTVAAGRIVSQSPAAGSSVLPGASVAITLSRGPQPDTVPAPDVRGLTLESAEDAITNAGLELGEVTEAYSSTVEAGRIIAQNPAAGSLVSPGSSVAITLSLGPESVAAPDLHGLTLDSAENALTGMDLVLGQITEAFSDTVAEGLIITQSPAPGTLVPPGTAVAVTVSLGPELDGGADNYEPDDTPEEASTILVDGEPQSHNFHDAEDIDWIKFEIAEPGAYTMATYNLGTLADTTMTLLDAELNVLAYNDDFFDLESVIQYSLDSPGYYYLLIAPIDEFSSGPDATYDVVVFSGGGIGSPDYQTEVFDPVEEGGANDLESVGIYFFPDSSEDYYFRDSFEGVYDYYYPTDSATPIDFGIADPYLIELDPSQAVDFYGVSYDKIYVSSQGWISFGTESAGNGTLADHFMSRQISLGPLDARSSGTVSFEVTEFDLVITYDSVETDGGTNSIQAIFYNIGTVEQAFELDLIFVDESLPGIVGLSNAPLDGADPEEVEVFLEAFEETDLYSSGPAFGGAYFFVDTGADGRVYATDFAFAEVQVFDSDLTFQFAIEGNTPFSVPTGIAVDDAAGEVYVADAGNLTLQVFDTEGVFKREIGAALRDSGFFGLPFGMDIADDGTVYLVDLFAGIVFHVDGNGEILGLLGAGASDIAVDSAGGLLVVELDFDSGFTKVSRYNSDGEFQETLPAFENADECGGIGVDVDSEDNIYVSTDCGRVVVYDGETYDQTSFGELGTGPGEFGTVYGISVYDVSDPEPGRSIFIADPDNGRIQKLDETGVFVTSTELE